MEKLLRGESLDFNLCIICQNRSADDLVEMSTSQDKLFSSIGEKGQSTPMQNSHSCGQC